MIYSLLIFTYKCMNQLYMLVKFMSLKHAFSIVLQNVIIFIILMKGYYFFPKKNKRTINFLMSLKFFLGNKI